MYLFQDQGVWHTTKYTDVVDVPSGSESEAQMWDRRLLYCVPVCPLVLPNMSSFRDEFGRILCVCAMYSFPGRSWLSGHAHTSRKSSCFLHVSRVLQVPGENLWVKEACSAVSSTLREDIPSGSQGGKRQREDSNGEGVPEVFKSSPLFCSPLQW